LRPGARDRSRPKRSLGQNFLIDANIQRKIVAALGADPEDEVLEIGPGRGALTRHLVGEVDRLVLVELDDDLAARLEAEYGSRPDVEVVHGDILDIAIGRHVADPEALRVIGNVPYNITTPIIFRLLQRPRPRDIILMVQDEVADRVVAPVGTKTYGALSVGVRSVATAERCFKVGRQAFRPVPGVESAILRITPFRPERIGADDETRLRRLVRAAFQWRRKQLGKTLRDHPDLRFARDVVDAAASSTGISLEDRPERLGPEEFVSLALALP
jgi:16S rRNA (adenine1518-N6/adenine1519-N6)-dimethyltransferase